MNLQLANFTYNNGKFYVDNNIVKLSPMRARILKLLCENHDKGIVSYNRIIQELYYDSDYIKDEPDSASFKVILYYLRRQLETLTNNKVQIIAHKGQGISIEEYKKETKPIVHLSQADVATILSLHASGISTPRIAKRFGVSKSRIYDYLLRSKQDKQVNRSITHE